MTKEDSGQRIVEEGAQHFREEMSYRNPYKIGTSEFNDFERGWVQALKRSGMSSATNSCASWWSKGGSGQR